MRCIHFGDEGLHERETHCDLFLLVTFILKQTPCHYWDQFVQGHSIVQHLQAGSSSQAEAAHIIIIDAGSLQPSLMLLVLSASPWLVTGKWNYSLSCARICSSRELFDARPNGVMPIYRTCQVNSYCLIRLQSSHPQLNMNAMPCGGRLWGEVLHLLPRVKRLKSCLPDAIVVPRGGSPSDGIYPIF